MNHHHTKRSKAPTFFQSTKFQPFADTPAKSPGMRSAAGALLHLGPRRDLRMPERPAKPFPSSALPSATRTRRLQLKTPDPTQLTGHHLPRCSESHPASRPSTPNSPQDRSQVSAQTQELTGTRLSGADRSIFLKEDFHIN